VILYKTISQFKPWLVARGGAPGNKGAGGKDGQRGSGGLNTWRSERNEPATPQVDSFAPNGVDGRRGADGEVDLFQRTI
jgi:hypothetical protein